MSFAVFLYNESVIISNLQTFFYYIHVKYKFSYIKNILRHDTHLCYLSKKTDFMHS